jgi:membrane protease YdiL (CAAX protease family)
MSSTRGGKLLAWVSIVSALAALNYGSRIASGKPPRDTLYRYDAAVGGLILYAIMLGLVVWIAQGLTREQLGLRRPRSWPRALGLALGVLITILVVEAALEPLLHATREQGLEPQHWEPSRAGAFALNAAVVVLAAPLVEELTFRGVGFGLLRPFGALVAVAGTALAFAAAHGLLAGLVALFVFGSALAWLRLKTQSLFPGMLLHACYNGAALAIVFVR